MWSRVRNCLAATVGYDVLGRCASRGRMLEVWSAAKVAAVIGSGDSEP